MMPAVIWENKKERKEILKKAETHVQFLAEELGERTLREYDSLNHAKYYIKDYFSCYGHEADEQKYMAQNMEVGNVVAEIRGFDQPDNIIVIGAHYDTVEGTPGADDNGSAVAGLLEVYRLLAEYRYKKTIRFVAFTLEEPPFFSTDLMGSMQYATSCRQKKENIELMICLEMIGYGCKKCPQEFPYEDLKKDKPPYGDYLGVFSLPSCLDHVHFWKKRYNSHAKRKIFDIVGPASIPGMDLSDHRSFIKNGYPAIMLSDSGYYRNKNYHQSTDTADTLNYNFLAENIHNIYITLKEVLNLPPLEKVLGGTNGM